MKLIITDLDPFPAKISGEYKLIHPGQAIHPCVGCFGCWVKTPGICVIHDGYEKTGIDMSECEEMILVCRCCYGSVSPFVKMVQDRALSYLHPYFEIRNDEMHHQQRYPNSLALSAHFYGEDVTRMEKETAIEFMESNALNYDGHLREVHFYHSAKDLERVYL